MLLGGGPSGAGGRNVNGTDTTAPFVPTFRVKYGMNIWGDSGNNSGAGSAVALVAPAITINGVPAWPEVVEGSSRIGGRLVSVAAALSAVGRFVSPCASGGNSKSTFGGGFGSSNRNADGPTTGR